MILAVHAAAGAALGSTTQNLGLAAILGLASHYLLDAIPHREYSIKQIEVQNFKKSFRDFLKVFFDLLIGCLIVIFIIRQKQDYLLPISFGAFFGLVPDGLALSYFILNKIKPKWLIGRLLEKHHLSFHQKIQRKATSRTLSLIIQFLIVITGLSIVWFSK